jgi:uncharacterized protein YndB with AHSA1/START domain
VKSARRGEVSIHVGARPDRVWAVLAELERMGEWSPECYRVEWLDGATSPARPGARFKGRNKYGWMRWSMTCEVKEAEPGQVLAFSTMRGAREVVCWRYHLEAANGGTDVTESFECVWLPLDARIAEDFLMRDRDRRREAGMRQTLERIKAIAEAEERSGASPGPG